MTTLECKNGNSSRRAIEKQFFVILIAICYCPLASMYTFIKFDLFFISFSSGLHYIPRRIIHNLTLYSLLLFFHSLMMKKDFFIIYSAAAERYNENSPQWDEIDYGSGDCGSVVALRTEKRSFCNNCLQIIHPRCHCGKKTFFFLCKAPFYVSVLFIVWTFFTHSLVTRSTDFFVDNVLSTLNLWMWCDVDTNWYWNKDDFDEILNKNM